MIYIHDTTGESFEAKTALEAALALFKAQFHKVQGPKDIWGTFPGLLWNEECDAREIGWTMTFDYLEDYEGAEDSKEIEEDIHQQARELLNLPERLDSLLEGTAQVRCWKGRSLGKVWCYVKLIPVLTPVQVG